MALETTILTATKQISSITTPDTTVELSMPLTFSNNSRQYVRLIKASISARLPNIYSLGTTFNNGLIRISNDGGVNWQSVQLPNGVYTVSMIEAALNSVAAGLGWWISDSDPGIFIRFNLSTHFVYFTLNSTKMAAGQLGIDLSQSRIDEVLGFNAVGNQTFIVDGVATADSPAEIDWFGNNLSLRLIGFSHLSIKDGQRSEEIASIPITSAMAGNEIVYPINGINCPMIPLQSTIKQLNSYGIQVKGSRIDTITGAPRDVYILDGVIDISFELLWR